MSDRQRQRIPISPRKPNVIEDILEFKKNKCTLSARQIATSSESIDIHLWGDQHYFIRYHQGGDNGEKRHGIEPEIVERLVRKSTKYLLLYGSAVRGFKFINYEGAPESKVRIVLQESFKDSFLNVLIEAHLLEANKYEVTVITALCVNDFRVEDGQYAIEIYEGGSMLKRCINKKMQDICSF